jgi:hypothetical protein
VLQINLPQIDCEYIAHDVVLEAANPQIEKNNSWMQICKSRMDMILSKTFGSSAL